MALLDLFIRRPKKEEEARAFLVRFLNNRYLRQKVAVAEKRRETRSNLVIGVWIIPLIEGSPVLNHAFPTVTKDFTTSGLGIVVDTQLTGEELLVVIPVKTNESVLRCKVLNSSSIGAGFRVLGLQVVGLIDESQHPDLEELLAFIAKCKR
jgi:hypothetical protein